MSVNEIPIDDNIRLRGDNRFLPEPENPADISKAYKEDDPTETDLANNDYVPFYDTSAGAKKKTLWSNIVNKLKSIFNPPIADIVNVYGAKNLIPYPYYDTTKTTNGITFTDNGDGTITAIGTATNNAFFNLVIDTLDLPNGEYILSGDLDTGTTFSNSPSAILFNKDNVNGTSYWNYGETVPVRFTVNNWKVWRPRIRIRSGETVNQTFKPMLRLASIEDNTYVPYAMTNKELTEDTSVAYKTTDSASTTINNTDYIPMSDSNGNRKKLLWSNIVDKLKAIFLTNFVGTTAQWNALTREQKARYKTADFTDDSTPSPIDANPIQGSGNAVASGGVYSELVKVRAFTYLGDAQTPKTANTAVTINLSESMDNYVLLYIRYGFGWGWSHPLIVSPASFGVPCISTCEGQGRIRIDRVSATAIKITTESYDLGHANNDDRTAVWGIIKK